LPPSNEIVVVGQVGDSRLYLLTNDGIEKITRDHSPVGILEDSCKISELEAMHHPNRNEVFRDVGSAEHSPSDPDFIDIYEFRMPPDGALLLCSDGLTDLLTSHEILSLYRRYKRDLRYFVEELVAAANEAGGMTTSPWWLRPIQHIFRRPEKILCRPRKFSYPEVSTRQPPKR
jgi:serine/threonine protein phosphatase PrpC